MIAVTARDVPEIRARMTDWARDPTLDGADNWFRFFLGPRPDGATESRVFDRVDDVGATIAGTLAVQRLNLSHAADNLGLMDGVAVNNVLTGADVNLQAGGGILGALLDLERALRADDTTGIVRAGHRLDRLREGMTRVHGIIGARAQAMSAQRAHGEEVAQSMEILLSEVQDLDYAEAISRLQAATTQMQAGMQSSALISQLSLMDYLR